MAYFKHTTVINHDYTHTRIIAHPRLENNNLGNQAILVFHDISHPQLLTFQILIGHWHNCS